MVAGGTRRLRGQTRRGPLGVCRESRRRVVDGTGRQSGRILCLLWLSTLLWLCVSVFVVTMDRLPSEKQELLRKSSTDRLRDKLYQVGWDDEKVLALSRAELLEAAAEVVLVTERADEAVNETLPMDHDSTKSSPVPGVSSAIRLKELELEEKRLEREERERAREDRKMELELKKLEAEAAAEERRLAAEERRRVAAAEEKRAAAEAEAAAEERRAAAEDRRRAAAAEERRATAEAEERRLAAEERRARLEIEKLQAETDRDVRLREIQGLQPGAEGNDDPEEQVARGHPRNDTLAGRTKMFGDAMRHVLPKMPSESAEIPQFFETVEKLFLMYEVPDDIKSKLLIPVLTAQAKALVNRMSVENMGEYPELKRFLLAEYKLTPREYKVRFDTTAKNADETYVLFAARLRNLLQYYLSSKNVGQDFDRLCELIIADRLKSSLPHGPLNYVLSLEGDDWFTSERVAYLADTFVSHRADSGSVKPTMSNSARVASAAAAGGKPSQYARGGYGGQTQQRRGNINTSPTRRCFVCNQPGHMAKDCSKRFGAPGHQPPPRGNFRGAGSYPHQFGSRGNRGGAQVKLCAADNPVRTVIMRECGVQCEEEGHCGLTEASWEFGEFPTVKSVTSHSTCPQVRVFPLQYLQVKIEGNSCTALNDSGCQIPIVSNRLFGWCADGAIGRVNLHGFGQDQVVQAPLVNLTVKLDDPVCKNECDDMREIPLVCAVTDLGSVEYDVILPAAVVSELQAPAVSVVSSGDNPCVIDNVTQAADSNGQEGVQETDFLNVDDLPEDNEEGDSTALIAEQRADPSLAPGWRAAEAERPDFVIHRDVLYHKDRVEGQPVSQLCVPEGRRASVLKLAHDSVFGGHLGERKTRERIRLSFFWPELRKSVVSYVRQCANCQLRSRPLTTDRVPITPVTRCDVPFQVLNVDCIGPIDPPSSLGHRYCLCVVDNCTRWPAVYMLKSLTAKAVCDALLDLFVNVGVPKVIVSDQGTNFTSQLTREMLMRLGCCPRFNTPGHPEASGMVERFNQTCKNMLSHVVQAHGRQWHKYVPMMVWALREVPNATTGVSPYLLVYGRVPRGPLTILKEVWSGDRGVSPSLSRPVEEYLQDLRDKMETTAQYATEHTEKAQAGYVSRYNLRARHKQFQVGDQVIVLAPDSGGKLLNKWQGPGVVKEVRSANSYLVDLGDGGTRHIHANKIRRFVARVNGCAVVNDADNDFGRVVTPANVDVSDCPSARIDEAKLEHLDPQQRQQLLTVLDEFADRFSDKPGLCDVTVHRIRTTSEFVPRQMRPYRVPDKFKPEVDRQITELLEMGLIRPSDSPMASPIVCVAKRDGGVRLAVDYRYLNKYTIGDAYPMTTIDEIVRSVGRGRFISTFDAKSGYWQIPVEPEDRWLTAFVTHDGLYEWVRMPFGLKNAGATFVRAVRSVLQPMRSCADSYIDDMAVGSIDWRNHMSHVRQFLCIMRVAGITLNLAKCEFGKPRVKFVGRIVGSGTHHPDPERVEGMVRVEPPSTKKQLRQILGALGYYREYIPHYAEIARPLTDLTRDCVPCRLGKLWTEECQRALDSLCQQLTSHRVLRVPSEGQPFILHTDSSGKAVGASLGQLDQGGVEQPLAFASQKLTPAQQVWSTIEREAYAVIWALNKYRDLIFGHRVTVYCDHNPLQYIRECAPKSAKLLRWSLALQEFDLDFVYKKGSTNVVADWLSRKSC